MGSASGGMRMGALEFLDIITPEEASTLVSEPAVVPLFSDLHALQVLLLAAQKHTFHTASNKSWDGGLRSEAEHWGVRAGLCNPPSHSEK